jgi:hypothetical protein
MHREVQGDRRRGRDSRFHHQTIAVQQLDNTEEDAFHVFGSAIADAVADDEAHTTALLEVWSELEEQRKLG